MRLIRSKNSFCLMENKMISKICILDASLFVRRAKISPGMLLAHAVMLNKLPPSIPLRESKLKHSQYMQASWGIDTQFGQLPKRIIVGFVNNKPFNSDRKLNPFNFKNYGKFFFVARRWQIPSRPIQLNFSKDEPLYVAYHTLFSGIHFLNEVNSFIIK